MLCHIRRCGALPSPPLPLPSSRLCPHGPFARFRNCGLPRKGSFLPLPSSASCGRAGLLHASFQCQLWSYKPFIESFRTDRKLVPVPRKGPVAASFCPGPKLLPVPRKGSAARSLPATSLPSSASCGRTVLLYGFETAVHPKKARDPRFLSVPAVAVQSFCTDPKLLPVPRKGSVELHSRVHPSTASCGRAV